MSEASLRRLSELALIAIASVWGLTFVMVQDAIALLSSMAFLAYSFIPAALLVALILCLAIGAGLIMTAIVAVEIAPRPPRPLPEG